MIIITINIIPFVTLLSTSLPLILSLGLGLSLPLILSLSLSLQCPKTIHIPNAIMFFFYCFKGNPRPSKTTLQETYKGKVVLFFARLKELFIKVYLGKEAWMFGNVNGKKAGVQSILQLNLSEGIYIRVKTSSFKGWSISSIETVLLAFLGLKKKRRGGLPFFFLVESRPRVLDTNRIMKQSAEIWSRSWTTHELRVFVDVSVASRAWDPLKALAMSASFNVPIIITESRGLSRNKVERS